MQIKTENTRTVNETSFAPTAWIVGFLAWLVECDRRYREAHKLRNLPDERLQDMGMTRSDAKNAYRR
ncbi:hypothetical protein RXV86_07920 [Alisedimentitalea sp. MJ-SS2]|uniref:DUF1127 domain-containing protein n=1 Tax=Aliisedimentitalea sp. MJ-SS2 TaxID=3049795 RepID=UPI00290B4CD5|nr:hypothetical protein [Alisedimentitalea sp. MJ-SS2]MDU8927308.1 hypothetical protein [Alisedimentitalea sp. MJ-SS2]